MVRQLNHIFENSGIQYTVIMPDSMNSKLYPYIQEGTKIIQCLNETDVVTITSGLNLSGNLAVAMMENSGMRSACDVISRFETLHHIHNIYILSSRGDVGEENWWGIRHKQVTDSIISDLRMLSMDIHDLGEFAKGLSRAIKALRTEQVSVVLNLSTDFFETTS